MRWRATPILLLIALGLALAPIVLNPVPPLGDYPGHLARVFVLHQLLHGAGFADMFQYRWAIVPNLAIDAVVLGLMELGVPVEIAGRVFLGGTVVLLGTGVMALHRATFGRWSAWPILAFAFIYNELFLYGFVNFLFGVGLAFWAATLWQLSIDRRPAWSVPLMLLSGLALFFCHLATSLLLLGLVASCGIGDMLNGRRPAARRARWLPAGLVAGALPLALLFLAPLTADHAPPHLADLAAQLAPSSLLWRARSVWRFAAGYDGLVDAASLLSLALIACYAAARRGLRLDLGLTIASTGLSLIYLILPDGWFGTLYLPERLPAVIAMIGFAGSEVRLSRHVERGAFVALVAALIVARGVTVERAWQAADAVYRPLLDALDRLPAGARIFSAIAYQGDFAAMLRPPFQGLPAYAVIRRGAYSPQVFADPSQNLVTRRPPYDSAPGAPPNLRADRPAGRDPGDSPYAPDRLRFYDFALILHPELWPPPPSGLRPILQQPGYVLVAIDHPL